MLHVSSVKSTDVHVRNVQLWHSSPSPPLTSQDAGRSKPQVMWLCLRFWDLKNGPNLQFQAGNTYFD